MRRFSVNVNGYLYEVEIEELKAGVTATTPIQAIPTPASAPIPTVAPTPIPAAALTPVPKVAPPKESKVPVSDAEGTNTISAPMPGTILSISVNLGDLVTKGQVLCILEAMKMENEIISPYDGKISAIEVRQDESVSPGQIMFIL